MTNVSQIAGQPPAVGPDARITKKVLQALAPLPDTAMRLLALLDDPDVPLREIASVAARDVGLSATMLRMANSSMFGLRGRVGSISDALRVVGTAQARLLVLASGISQAAQREMTQYGLGAGQFMRHSELVANLTMYVGYELRYTNVGIAYSAGLLHDIGKIVINGLLQQQGQGQERGSTIAAEIQSRRCTVLEAEEALCGANHAQIGKQLGEMWALPADLTLAIAMHHDDAAALAEQTLAWCVMVANSVAGSIDETYPAFLRAPEIPPTDRVDLAKVLAAAHQFMGEVARSA